MNNYKLEVFSSDRQVIECAFHIYDLITSNLRDNFYKVIRSACLKLKNYNAHIGIFENGRQIIATEEIGNIPANADFKLEYRGMQQLPVLTNKKIYQDYIEYLIRENARGVKVLEKYAKYSCRADITTSWFPDDKGGYRVHENRDKSIKLQREYKIRVEITDKGYAYLWLDTKTLFASKLNLMDLIEKGHEVCGMDVKNEWTSFRQSGVVEEVCDDTVVDLQDFGRSLKDYYMDKGEEWRVKNIPDDTPVVKVKLARDNIKLPYYPQALVLIITREYMAKYDPIFSNEIDYLVKRPMNVRLECDREFLRDIGGLDKLGGLAFQTECCDPRYLGYKWGNVKLPRLVCGDAYAIAPGNDFQVFSHGFYEKPDRKIKIGYLYPKGQYDLAKQVANDIYCFAVLGRFHGEKDTYTKEKLMDIQATPMIQQEYETGNITDYKRAAYKLRDVDGIDIVIAIIPDGQDEDSPYNPFKKIWAEMNIPSQMITMKTARLFAQDAKNNGNKAKYFLHNIVLGILGKTGGIPWIVKDMPGGADCFIGLDVAMQDKGIHYPACSVVFDSHGRLLGFFKPKYAQRGEKITTEILQDIFDQVIISYEDSFGEKPRSVVIHRDGFSNEDGEWYEHYFKAQGIRYSIFEVRKNIRSKMFEENEGNMNPPMGACIYNDQKAFLVTTMMKNKKGSPNPLVIEKFCGDLTIENAVTQILYLSQLHVGSTNKMRLPITTGYADKICKNLDYVPAGQVENKLFFL